MTVEIVHKIMVQERGDRGIEFDSRDHSQIDDCSETVTLGEYTRGVLFFGVKSFLKTAYKRGRDSYLAHADLCRDSLLLEVSSYGVLSRTTCSCPFLEPRRIVSPALSPALLF